MNRPRPETELEQRDVKPTANRLLVWKCLSASPHLISLSDAEEALQTMDKSSIFRMQDATRQDLTRPASLYDNSYPTRHLQQWQIIRDAGGPAMTHYT